MILSNLNRLINLFIIIIIWACITELLKITITSLKLKSNTCHNLYVYYCFNWSIIS